MSRRSPTGFVFSVAAEVIAVVFIVSVLPRVDLRRSAGASPTSYDRITPPNETPSLLTSVPSWPISAERHRQPSTHETSYYQQRSQPADLPRSSPNLPTREPPPLITVDPARPDYVEQRLDRASQGLVNTVGSYVSQAANDLLSAPPPAAAPQPLEQQRSYAPSVSRLPSAVTPLVPTLPTAPPTSGSFPTQPQSHPPRQPRPWVRY
jgi:hypothetical protein